MKKLSLIIAALIAGMAVYLYIITAPANLTNMTATSAEKMAILDEEVPDWLEKEDVPSVSIAYIKDRKIAWTRAYGIQSPGVSAKDSTLYNIASMTKPVTAEVIIELAAQKTLSLDTTMDEKWIDPDIESDKRHSLLTPRQALQHRTGFPNWRYQTDDKLSFLHEPGTVVSYSGEGYAYVAKYAEELTGESFEELASQYVFEPASVSEISFTKQDWFEGRTSLPYRKGEFGKPVIRGNYNAADDIYATAREYADFMLLVMKRAESGTDIARQRFDIEDGGTPIYCKIRAKICPSADGYGLGWRVIRYDTQTIVVHRGSDWGEQTLALMRPEQKDGFVILTNGSNGGALIGKISEILISDPLFATYARWRVY